MSIIGEKMPDFALKAMSDDAKNKDDLDFSAYRGDKACFIDFYTSWWGGCNGAARSCDKLAEKYAAKGIKFLLCNIEKGFSKSKAKKFTDKNDIKYMDHFNGQAPALIGLKFIPHKCLIDNKGLIVVNARGDFEGELEKLANKMSEETEDNKENKEE